MQKIIAIVGMTGSGKSEAADFFRKKGYSIIRFGSVIDDAIQQAGLPWTPENNVIFRRKIREEEMDAVAVKLYPKIKEELSQTDNVILDGLYSWEEYTYLIKKLPQLKLLCIYASPSIRYKRLAQRKERPFSLQEARRRDITEIEDINKGGPIAIADYLIKNEFTQEKLHMQLEKFITWMKKNG